jgi:hypothetical protein
MFANRSHERAPSERRSSLLRGFQLRSHVGAPSQEVQVICRNRCPETRIRALSRNAPWPRKPASGARAGGRDDAAHTFLLSLERNQRRPHGNAREKFFVPSIGSITHRTEPPSSPSSSPRTPSPGRVRAICSRSARSTARSASVTGVRSGFVSICRSNGWNRGRPIASATGASSFHDEHGQEPGRGGRVPGTGRTAVPRRRFVVPGRTLA